MKIQYVIALLVAGFLATLYGTYTITYRLAVAETKAGIEYSGGEPKPKQVASNDYITAPFNIDDYEQK